MNQPSLFQSLRRIAAATVLQSLFCLNAQAACYDNYGDKPPVAVRLCAREACETVILRKTCGNMYYEAAEYRGVEFIWTFNVRYAHQEYGSPEYVAENEYAIERDGVPLGAKEWQGITCYAVQPGNCDFIDQILNRSYERVNLAKPAAGLPKPAQ
jgi:hypothetical protein